MVRFKLTAFFTYIEVVSLTNTFYFIESTFTASHNNFKQVQFQNFNTFNTNRIANCNKKI